MGMEAPKLAAALLVALMAVVPASANAATPLDPAAHVNVFQGTAPGAADFGTGGGAGNTFPGAALPFGMVQFSPDTRPGEVAFGGGYTYGDSKIRGFSLRHMSGPGCAAYEDFPITPTTQPVGPQSPAKPLTIDLADQYTAGFDHAHESGAPGAYRVTLNPGTAAPIDAELTATTRTGLARFTFPAGSRPSVLINSSGSAMGASDASVQIDPAKHELSGSVTSGQFCYQGNRYKLYFVARFDRPFAAYGTWSGPVLTPGAQSAGGSIPSSPFVYQPIPGGPSGIAGGGATAQAGGYATFDTSSGDRVVEARIGISSVSVAGARANLESEDGARSFDQIRSDARGTWNAALGRVRVQGGSAANLGLFYTSLYHALIEPSTWSDVDGHYMGFDGQVHDASPHVRYADISGWDTYRTQQPLLAMLFPRQASDIAASLVADAAESGALPKWSQANGHTHVMTGDPADLLLASTWAFGARGFDAAAALQAMVRGATRYAKASTSPDYYERQSLPDYLRLGWVPYENNTDNLGQTFDAQKVWGTASTSLEYALADFAIAQLAAARCDSSTYATFIKRAGNWRASFDPSVKLIQPRNADGSFVSEAPTSGTGFVEGSAAQYTLFVPQDPPGLFSALGGKAAAQHYLDAFFTQLNAGPAAATAYLGNEPTLGTPWLYTWLGEPGKAASIMRRAQLSLYRPTPDGMPGNDDLGTMSAWWVWAALGLYPAVPGTDLLTVGSPLFRSTVVSLPGRKTLRLVAPHAGPTRPYVRALAIDGRPTRRAWLPFRQLTRGGTLRFVLTPRATKRFGSARANLPPSPLSEPAAARCSPRRPSLARR